MRKNKLIDLLSKCTDKERTSLEVFIHAMYFNKDKAVKRLIHYLLEHFDDITVDKYKLYQVAYPDEKYDDKRYRYVISNSAKLITRFWLIENYESDKQQVLLDQMNIYTKRNLEKSYQQSLRNWEQLKEKHSNVEQKTYWQELKFYEAKEHHFEKKRVRQFDKNIEDLAKSYDRYYYLNRLRNACDMLNRAAIFQGQYQKKLTPSWFLYLEEQAFFEDPLIESYYLMWKMLDDPTNESNFEKFLNQIHLPSLKTDISTLRELYLAAINHALRKLRIGGLSYRKKALELYLEAIDKKILLDNGELSPWTFGNVVKLALKVKKDHWIKQFIEEKSKILPLAFRENALNYNLAEVNYASKAYNEAQQQLAKVSFSDLNYYLGARILLAKIYYENEETEPLLSLISAFTIFLKRNKKISLSIKQSCLNFCELLFQLVRRHKKRIATLGEEITKTELLAERDWLIKQYQTLVN